MNRAILTIDDFPSQNTPAIVDYLSEHGITALFFAVGQNVEQHCAEAQYAIEKGMLVGNHSYSHPAFSSLSLRECIEEIEKCEQILNELFARSGVPRRHKLFRFPYGDKGGTNKDALQYYLRNQGFSKLSDVQIPYPWWKEYHLDQDIDTFWTFDFEEYALSREDIWKKMHDPFPKTGAALFGEGNRHFLLMHAFDETEKKLPEYYRLLIDHLLENGCVFDTPKFI